MKWIAFALMVAAHPSLAQFSPQLGARSQAMGNASLSLVDVWSVYNNPGAMGSLEKTSIAMAYSYPFFIHELANQSLAIGYHHKKVGAIGLHFQHSGFELYREMQGGIAYGRQLHNGFSAGIGVHYHRIALGGIYGSTHALSGTFGIRYAIDDHLQMGMRIANINRSLLSSFENERFPTVLGLGLVYVFSKKAQWAIEVEKDLVHPLNVKSGLELQPHPFFAVRLGVNSFPVQAAFGCGVQIGRFQVDLSTDWHTQLGLQTTAGMHFFLER